MNDVHRILDVVVAQMKSGKNVSSHPFDTFVGTFVIC